MSVIYLAVWQSKRGSVLRGIRTPNRDLQKARGVSPGRKVWGPCISWGSSWSHVRSDSWRSGAALANSKFAKCQSNSRRSSSEGPALFAPLPPSASSPSPRSPAPPAATPKPYHDPQEYEIMKQREAAALESLTIELHYQGCNISCNAT